MPSLPIKLPPGFTPTVAVGDTVKIRQPLAMRKAGDDTAVINIAQELSLPVIKAGKAMKVIPGDSVTSGTIIAARSGMLGLGGQKVVSSVSGKVLTFERRTGEVTIQINGGESGDDESYLSPVAGKITMCDNGEIVIDTESDGSLTEAGSGGSIKGDVHLISYNDDTPVPLHLLTPDCIGKIVAARNLDREGLVKVIGMEVLGIIVRTIADDDLTYLTEKRLTIPVVQVSEDEFRKISKHSGKKVYLDGEKKSVVILHE